MTDCETVDVSPQKGDKSLRAVEAFAQFKCICLMCWI